jgi:ABC-type glutathione transport system ATPase component
MSIDTVLSLDGVMKQYGPRSARHTAVQEISLSIDNATTVGVVGESGSGKSTLARMLVGLETPTSGTVRFGDVPVPRLLATKAGRMQFRRAVQFVGQDTTSSFDPRHTLLSAVISPAMRLCGLSRGEAVARAEETFALLELPDGVGGRYPGDISGGQRQRVSLARALVVRPRILLCDEVVSALDVSVQGAILNLIKEYCAVNGAGLVFVSHGLPATAFVARDLLVMYHGEVVEYGSTDDVVERPQHPYTRQLLAAYTGGVGALDTEAVLS